MTANGAPAPPAYRDGSVLRWLAAYAASMIGDGVCFLAFGWAAQRVTGPAGVGLVMAVSAVPRVLLMLGGGVVADRYGPRRVVLGSDAVRCAVVLAVALALGAGTTGLWPLVLGALVFGAVDALFVPAVGALPPRLTSRDQLARVQGMSLLAVRLGNVAGPPLGGFALGLGGGATAFAVAAGLFAVSLALLAAVRLRPPAPGEATASDEATVPDERAGRPRPSPSGELVDGFRHMRRRPLLARLALSGALCEFAVTGPLNVGLVLLAAERGWGAAGVGWLVSAFGAGAGTSALVLAVRGGVPRAGAVQCAAVAATSLCVGAVGLAPGLPAAVGLAALAGLAGGLCGGLSRALVQVTADPAYLGRVTSVTGLGATGLAPLSYPVFGAAAGAWGTGPVFVCCGLLGLGSLLPLASRVCLRAELPVRKGPTCTRPASTASPAPAPAGPVPSAGWTGSRAGGGEGPSPGR
ncbi:MFS transporter [Streptomyces albiaxialis]|uniref:MFS transporter n=1 Tax=Streptomyces albiaxialis TaxID=329523 RepID=UPI0031D9FE07